MVPGLLAREILTAIVGAAGMAGIGMITPLQDHVKKVLQGGVFLTTVFLMGRFGGLW